METIALIILAGRNKENLAQCLNSVKALTTLPNELIIVFDIKYHGEPDQISEIPGCELKLISYYGTGYQPHMRNIAIKNCGSEYLWFIDDDITLDPKSCENLKNTLEIINRNSQVGAIAGRIVENSKIDMTKFKDPIFLSYFRAAVGYFNWDYKDFPENSYQSILAINKEKFLVVPFVQGTNMIFQHKAVLDVGGFDEDLGFGYSSYEDSEICFALSKSGYSTIYCPNISLVHHKLPRISGASRGYEDYGYAKSLTRNYTISLLKNKYPTAATSFLYALLFTLIHQLRVYKYSNKQLISSRSLVSLFRSSTSVFSGLYSGIRVVIRSKGKRIGL
jgi:GT2 family glycosyltransferase